jgi:hypothetical protein
LKLFAIAPLRGSLVKIEDRSMECEGAMQAKDSLDGIIAAMGAILMAAPQNERQKLAQAIEQFAIRFPTSFVTCATGIRHARCAAFFMSLSTGWTPSPS